MTHASVFSGIGGPEVAAAMLGWKNLFHCEINPFGKAVLDYWFPESKSYEDITKTDFTPWRGRVNVLTGGFPCQPFSYAGKRRGAEDDRYLWPSMFRCIDEIRPDWVVCENVAGILTMVEQGTVTPVASEATLFDADDDFQGYQLRETFTLQRICDDLTSHGYEVQPVLIPACGVGAPHRRDRVFIVGHRIAPDTDIRPDGRIPGEDAGTGREERLQERNEVRFTDKSNQVRSEVSRADTSHANRPGREESLQPGRGKDSEEERARLDNRTERSGGNGSATDTNCDRGDEVHEHLQPKQPDGTEPERYGWKWPFAYSYCNGYSSQAESIGTEGDRSGDNGQQEERSKQTEWVKRLPALLRAVSSRGVGERWAHFPTVSPIHRGNDGLPFSLDNLTIPASRWRNESLKAYGNAIVPQVMYEIFRAIELVL